MATAAAEKPEKPYPEFPLFAHQNGQWCKKIRGKQWFFGPWRDPDAALRKYLDEVDEIQAGRDVRRVHSSHVDQRDLTVHDLCNLYLERQQARVDKDEISGHQFTDCYRSCRFMVRHFGKFMRVSSLQATDFQQLREAFPDTWGTHKAGNEITRMRGVFRWGADSELIARVPTFGPDFRKPSRLVKRRDRQQREVGRGGKLDFTTEELQTLLKASKGWLKACILLGINGGMGNADCGRLSTAFFDPKSGWYDLPRHKTGIDRRFPLWPETIKAIRDAMMQRPIAKDDADDSLCFLTSHGRPLWWEVKKSNGEVYKRDNITQAFTKLCISCDVSRQGRGFYSLRRTFETVAGATKDQVAVDFVMGHADESMAAVYRQGIEDERLRAVCDHVRKWLKKTPAKKK